MPFWILHRFIEIVSVRFATSSIDDIISFIAIPSGIKGGLSTRYAFVVALYFFAVREALIKSEVEKPLLNGSFFY